MKVVVLVGIIFTFHILKGKGYLKGIFLRLCDNIESNGH